MPFELEKPSPSSDRIEAKYASEQLIPEADAVETSRPGELDGRQRYELSGRQREKDAEGADVCHEKSADRVSCVVED